VAVHRKNKNAIASNGCLNIDRAQLSQRDTSELEAVELVELVEIMCYSKRILVFQGLISTTISWHCPFNG
jgi:hypothetical protein